MSEQKTEIYINPPPSDKKCEKCGIHISELKPFGVAGDPLVGDFNGQILLKTYRSMYEGPPIEKYETILNELIFDNEEKNNINELYLKYGKENVEDAFVYSQMSDTLSASWECRNCIIK